MSGLHVRAASVTLRRKGSIWKISTQAVRLPAGRTPSTPARSISLPCLFSLFLPTWRLLWLTPHLALHAHTHSESSFFSPSVNHPHLVTRDQSVVSPVYVPFSGVTSHHVHARGFCLQCVSVRALKCARPHVRLWKGANALALLQDSSVLLVGASWKSLSLATMWSNHAEARKEKERAHIHLPQLQPAGSNWRKKSASQKGFGVFPLSICHFFGL